MELEASESGILKGIRAGVEAGASVPVGDTIAYIAKTKDETVPTLPPLGDAGKEIVHQVVEKNALAIVEETGVPPENGGPVRAAPAVRRIARELGVDLQQVKGSGPGGRILEADVQSYMTALEQAGKQPKPDSEEEVAGPMTISPVARRMAEELGVDLKMVKPASPSGRITKEDVSYYFEFYGSRSALPQIRTRISNGWT